MSKVKEVDVLVIGAGTAGVNAARQAVRGGAKNVVVIHKPDLINTCVELGCMPSKSILAGADMKLTPKQVSEDRDEHIKRLSQALTVGFESEEFELIEGHASFTSKNSIIVKSGTSETTYQAESFVIATGSTPFIPPIPGIDELDGKLLTSDDVVAKGATITEIPERLLVLGGGPIGLELATFFYKMGSHVTVVEKGRLLTIFDVEFSEERVKAAESINGFDIIIPAVVHKVEERNNSVVCTIEHNDYSYEETVDALLIATGRQPNTNGLNLEKAGVEVERGRIVHDDYLKTTQPNIFVAGDVTGHHQILHYAAEMGKVAGYNAANKTNPRRVPYDKFMMAVSFDMFPSALIGMTEQEARNRGIDVLTAIRRFDSIGLGILKREEFGMWKLVADRNSMKVIGSQVLGPASAGELMQILVPIIHNGNTYGQILSMPWYHPTFSEIVKSLANDLCHEDSTFCPGM